MAGSPEHHISGGAAYHLAACSQPGCEAFRAGAFVPTVRTDDQGRAADQGGEMLYSYVQRGYETILSGERKLSEMLNLEQGEICIGASDMTLKYFLLPYLEEFRRALPGNPRDGDECADSGDDPPSLRRPH